MQSNVCEAQQSGRWLRELGYTHTHMASDILPVQAVQPSRHACDLAHPSRCVSDEVRSLLLDRRWSGDAPAIAFRTRWERLVGMACLCAASSAHPAAVCDAFDTCIDGFHDGIGAKGWRHEDDADVGTRHLGGFFDGVEHRDGVVAVLDELATFAGRDARHDFGAVVEHLLGVEEALAPGDALHENFGIFVDEDAHDLT